MQRFIPIHRHVDSEVLRPTFWFALQGDFLGSNLLRSPAKGRLTPPAVLASATDIPGLEEPFNGFTTFRQAIRTLTVQGLAPES